MDCALWQLAATQRVAVAACSFGTCFEPRGVTSRLQMRCLAVFSQSEPENSEDSVDLDVFLWSDDVDVQESCRIAAIQRFGGETSAIPGFRQPGMVDDSSE